jgi:hypothetical protein
MNIQKIADIDLRIVREMGSRRTRPADQFVGVCKRAA